MERVFSKQRKVVTCHWEDAWRWGWGQTNQGSRVCAMSPKGRTGAKGKSVQFRDQKQFRVSGATGVSMQETPDNEAWMSEEDSGLHSLD